MIKGLIHKDIAIINIYTPNIDSPKYSKQILTELKGKTNNTVMAEGLNILFSTMIQTKNSMRKHQI